MDVKFFNFLIFLMFTKSAGLGAWHWNQFLKTGMAGWEMELPRIEPKTFIELELQ